MISDALPHTYVDQDRKFYVFFEHYDAIIEEQSYKGFHFYILDQHGYCWFSATNTTRQFVKNIGNGVFCDRTTWEANGLPYREPLKRDEWMDKNVDSAYALEMTRQLTGIDLLLIKRAEEGN